MRAKSKTHADRPPADLFLGGVTIRAGRPRNGAGGKTTTVMHVSVPQQDYDEMQAFRRAVRDRADTVVSPTDIVRASLVDYLRKHRAWLDAPPQEQAAAD